MSGIIINSATLSDVSDDQLHEWLDEEEIAELLTLRAIQRKEEREEQRLLRLEERERKRKERKEERKRRQQKRLRGRCESLLATYQSTQQQLEKAVASRSDMLEHFSGLELPAAPELPEQPELSDNDLTEQDVQTMHDAVQWLHKTAKKYQQEVDESLMQYHRHQAARDSADKIEAWSSAFSARAIRSAADVIATLEKPALFVADQQREIRLGSIRNKAKEAIAAYCNSMENDSDVALPDAIIITLDQVLNAENMAQATVKLAQLKQKLTAHADEQRHQEALLIRQQEQEKKRAQTELVVRTMTQTLENMGYAVSGIEDAVFARNGELYAMLPDDPEHAMRFSFTSGSSDFVSSPVRIKEQSQTTSEVDTREMHKEDAEFDAHWCNESSFAVKDKLKERGINMRFTRQHAPGELNLEQVDESALGEILQQERSQFNARRESHLREQTHD